MISCMYTVVLGLQISCDKGNTKYLFLSYLFDQEDSL